jgi:rubrerythrin
MAKKTDPTDVGLNRTGIGTSPVHSSEMIEGVEKYQPTALGSEEELFEYRLQFSRAAGPLGTIPPPTRPKGLAKTAVQLFKGHKATVLIDKLGERLAFERSGARLYDALLVKAQAGKLDEGSLRIEYLREIREDEVRHFRMVWEALEKLGADPTVMTPCADVVGTAALGWIQVVSDPRTTLTQALDVILFAELGDNDGWRTLISLTEGMGMDEMAEGFRQALAEEDDHLRKVRGWLAERLEIQAGAEVSAPAP